MKTKRVNVKITKGMETVIAREVWKHEVKCLEALYGVGNVEIYEKFEHYTPEGKKYKVVNEKPVVHPTAEVDYDEEFGRLQTIYGMHPQQNIPTIEYVYGKYEDRRMEKECNGEYDNYAPKKTSVNIEAQADVDEDIDDDGDMDYQEMTSRELKLFLDEHGVDYPSKGNKSVLIKAAEEFDRGVEV